MATALYPGSFDPPTVGHLDVVRRARSLFDRLIVGIGTNTEKEPLFTVAERVKLLRVALTDVGVDAEVASFDGLAVEFARRSGARCILRGVRSSGDFEYELSMAHMNRHLLEDVETVFVMPSLPYSFISARLIREAGRFGATLKGLVPECIRKDVIERLRKEGTQNGD
jgi:pantetheine-phosphate adenylyltransferase